MDLLHELRSRAESLSLGSEDKKQRRKFEMIRQNLEKDNCFLDMDMEHAYAVLRDLGISEESLHECYSALIAR